MRKSTEESRQFRRKDIDDEFSSVAEGVKITDDLPSRSRGATKKIDTGGGAPPCIQSVPKPDVLDIDLGESGCVDHLSMHDHGFIEVSQ